MALRDVVHEQPCPECNGTGARGGIRGSQAGVCQSCGGSGKLRQEPRVSRRADGGRLDVVSAPPFAPDASRVTRRG